MSPPPGPGPGAQGRDTDVHIDRLRLRVAGLTEDAARELARLIAEGLAPGLLRPAGTAGLAGLDSIQVQVQADAKEPDQPDLLARRILGEIGEIGRVLARDRASGGPEGEAAP
jgi:hypothetical protein